MLAVVILAAGESRRMGQPKALLPFPDKSATKTNSAKSKTFLEHLMEVTRHERVGVLRVVVGAHAKEIGASAKLDADELVVNEDWRRGQLSSLQAAIRSLPAEAEGMILCLVDHPLISASLVSSLIEAFDRTKRNIVIPTFRARRGHPVIFPRALFAELLDAPEEVGARAVVRAHAAEIVEVPTEEEGVVLNLNDPATLKEFLHP
ncbi:MAG TPA: nucleotidyltransferase family protein [Candidatus Acidoferrales bacterium]|nr:nucleotidyltransferase family protein [Candidatus Acidoferrales bacterium]